MTTSAIAALRARSALLPGLVVLLLGLLLTAYAVHVTSQGTHAVKALEFSHHVDDIATEIQAQFEHPLLVIRGFIGAVKQTGDYALRRKSFRDFMRSGEVAGELRGMRQFDYLEPEHGRFEAATMEPAAEAVRREAIERAVDSGKPSLSARFPLMQERSDGDSFFVVLAAYRGGVTPETVEERRANVVGIYSALIIADELLKSEMPRMHGLLDFALYEGLEPKPASLLLSTAPVSYPSADKLGTVDFGSSTRFHEDRRLFVGGRTLLLRVRSSADFDKAINQSAPLLAGLTGLLCSLAMSAGSAYVLMRRNRGSLMIVKGLAHERQSLTEQLQREQQALLANQDFHAAVLDSLPEHIAVIDSQGVIISVNDAWRRFGLQNGGSDAAVNPMGSNYLDVCQPPVSSPCDPDSYGASDIYDGVRAVLDGRCQRFDMEYPCDSPTEKRWFRVSATSMRGALRRVVISHKNTTEEHAIRSNLEELNRHLEASLAQAQELVVKADLASLAKSQFLSTMSHEIRTPMNAILGMLQLLEGTSLSTQQLDYTHKTVTAARALLGLINDILDFSKVEAGKLELDCQVFRCDQLWSDLSVIVSANIGLKPIEVLFDIDAAMPERMLGDILRLKQVLTNLSGNAVKFTHRGTIVVGTKLLQRNQTAAEIEFFVRDTGIGIAPQDQEHIFSAFSQAEASTTRRFGGTGLGLAISRQLVELMGGTLQLESAPGVGSTFFFRLSLPIVSDVAGQRIPATIPDPAHFRFLVVDDSLAACELMVATLGSRGYAVDAAHSGQEAIAQIQSRSLAGLEPYQAIILDWQMPGMDGWETARQIRTLFPSTEGLAPTLLIMVTANGRQLLSQRTRDEQAMLNGFLAKPVSASMLLDAVGQAATDGNAKPTGHGLTSSQRRLEGMRLLVVEDNLLNQQVAEELLSNEGALVALAANGQIGVAAVEAATVQFDAVLMDLQMPVLDGYCATRLIRESLGLKALPVIALSANALPQDRAASLAAGMNEHVGKPFDIAKLTEVLVRLTGWVTPTSASSTQSHAAAIPHFELAKGAKFPDSIDVAGALEWVGGDIRMYRSFLASFLDDVRGNAEQLQAHFEHKERSHAARVLHTLKGLAKTVGALELSGFAAHAEMRLKHDMDEEDVQTLVVQTREQINAATQALLAVAKLIDARMNVGD